MMKRIIILLLTGLASAGPVSAQLIESDTMKLQARATLTGNYQKGNVELFTLRSKLDFSFMPSSDWVFKSQNASLYQEIFDKKADNDIFSRNYLYYKPEHKLYPFVIAYISANYRRKITLRYFTGAGITYQLLNSDNHVIKISANTVFEESHFAGAEYNYKKYNGNDKIKLWRGTAYAGGWSYFAEKHIRIYYDAYWQPAFDDANNYRTQFDIGLDLPVWKGLSLTSLYTFTHENVVIKNIKQDDRILTFGLSYSIKKMSRTIKQKPGF